MEKIFPDLKEIKELRKKLNISQLELAKTLNISQSTISRIESETIDPPYSHVKKLFEFLKSKELEKHRSEKIAENIMTREIISVSPNTTIKDAINLMSEHNVSQIPVIDDKKNIGSLTAKKLQKHITDNQNLLKVKVDNLKELPFPEIEKNWSLKDISKLLTNYSAVLVKEYDKYIGIITDADLFKDTTK